MRSLIAATRNEAKLDELRRLVGSVAEVRPIPHDISLEDQAQTDALTAVEEGMSVEEIAAAKAVAWSRVLVGEIVIASDGGLEIPGLGDDWDPVRTRRFAGEDEFDLERAEGLLARTMHLRGEDRRISWREAVAVARDGQVLGQWSASSDAGFLTTEVDKDLIDNARGFWVDTLWICPEAGGRLRAELSSEERAEVGDHWSRLQSPVREYIAMNL